MGKAQRNLIGNKYNRLTVLEQITGFSSGGYRKYTAVCRCDCGNTTTVEVYGLEHGRTKSCGCWQSERMSNPDTRPVRVLESLDGKIFGRLTVVADGDHAECDTICVCGNTLRTSRYSLISGKTQSCGCFRREETARRHATHGHSRVGKTSPEYKCWQGMMTRCSNPNQKGSENYIRENVKVCDRWHTFANFLADMGPKPSPQHTLGRFEDSGPYDPWNCAWQTWKEQGLEQRKKHAILKTAVPAKSRVA